MGFCLLSSYFCYHSLVILETAWICAVSFLPANFIYPNNLGLLFLEFENGNPEALVFNEREKGAERRRPRTLTEVGLAC